LSPLLNNLDHVMEYNYTVGNKVILCHFLLPEERGSKDKYLFAAESFNKIAATLKHNGFDFAYHNHDFEFREVFDGKCGMDLIVENTDPHLVGLELHIGQLAQFDLDPVAYIKKLGRRVQLLHVHAFSGKDNAPFDSIPALKAARELDVPWAILENVYPIPIDFARVKQDVASIRDAAKGL
jgi:sugar phosphate isomerase/epimerase